MRLSIAVLMFAALAVRAEDPPDPHFLELELRGSDSWKAEIAAETLEKATEMPPSLAEAAVAWLEAHPNSPRVGSVARALSRAPEVREALARRALHGTDGMQKMLGQALFAEFTATRDEDVEALVALLNFQSGPDAPGMKAVVRVGAKAIAPLKKRFSSAPGGWIDPSGIALALVGGEGIGILMAQVRDGGEVEAEKGLGCLGYGGEEAVAKLAALMRDKDVYTRRRAVRVGVHLRDGIEACVASLEAGTGDGDEFVARSAAASLARLVQDGRVYWAEGHADVAEAAAKALDRGAAGKNGRGRGESAVALWFLHGASTDARHAEVVKGVIDALGDADAGARAAASAALFGTGGVRERLWPQIPAIEEAFAKPLLECAASDDATVAKAAFGTIRGLVDEETLAAKTLLLDGASHENANVRLAVATGAPDVCQRLRAAAREMLEALARDRDGAVAQRAKEGLARMPK